MECLSYLSSLVTRVIIKTCYWIISDRYLVVIQQYYWKFPSWLGVRCWVSRCWCWWYVSLCFNKRVSLRERWVDCTWIRDDYLFAICTYLGSQDPRWDGLSVWNHPHESYKGLLNVSSRVERGIAAMRGLNSLTRSLSLCVCPSIYSCCDDVWTSLT